MWQGKNLQSPWGILVCAWLMGFAMYTPMFSVPPIMHIIKEELFLSHAQVGLIFSIPLIMLAAFAVPSGALADRIGIRKAAGIGIIVIIIGSLLRGTSTSFLTLLAFSCIYGAGLGLVFPNLPKLVATWFPSRRIGLATGIYSVGISAGCALPLAITLPMVFPITNTFQGVFFIWTIPAVIAAITWWIIVREPHRSDVQSEQVAKEDKPSYQIWTNRTLWLVAILFFINDFIFYTWVGWSPELMMRKGASPDLAALMASVILWVCIPTCFVVPWASDRIGLRRPFLWTSFLLAALISLGAIHASLSLGWLIMVAFGIATAALYVILLVLPAELVPAEGVGRASGMILAVACTGGLVGPLVTGHILDVTGGLNLAFIILIGLGAVATYLALRLPETGPRVRL